MVVESYPGRRPSLGNRLGLRPEYYDVFGRMVTRTGTVTDAGASQSTTTTENFVYAGANIALILDGDGNIVERELTGLAPNQVFASETALPPGDGTNESGGQLAGAVNWYLTDNQGTVRDVVQLNGTSTSLVNHLVYSAFGQLVSQLDVAYQPTFGYDGAYQDPQTKLFEMGQRWYDAVDAVFASYDPSGLSADSNPYRFTYNSPTNFIDPSGLAPIAPMPPTLGPDSGPSGGQGVGNGDGFQCPCCTQAYGLRVSGMDLPEDYDLAGPSEGDISLTVG